MINNKKIVVFDFETDGKEPDVCNPVQLAAVVIEPRNLEIMDKSEFNVTMRPPELNISEAGDEEYYQSHLECIKWHAKIRNTTPEKILAEWKTYPEQSIGWGQFVQYLNRYRDSCSSKGGMYSAPIASGYNIINFDLVIVKRLCNKYKNVTPKGEQNIFYARDKPDLLYLMWFWFEDNDQLQGYSMDALREFFGISKLNAHDALQDVKDTADLLIRFLKLHRRTSKKVKAWQ